MKNNLLFDFTVDKAAKKVFITREFDADLSLVWDAFTKAEILDQWTAPAPYIAKTKAMNFEVGGKRFYAMVSPEGQERWALQKFISISPKTNFKYFNAFADKDENPEPYGSEWDYTFSEQNGIAKVHISIYNESLQRMEKVLEMGFTEGYKKTMENLEQYIKAQFKLRNELKTTTKARATSYLNFPGNTDLEIYSSRVLNAPLQMVYQAFADPTCLQKWWGPEGFTNTIQEFDLQPEGKWILTMHGPENGNYENSSVFKTVLPNKLISWTRISQPLFDMEVGFERIDDSKSKISFRMIFKTLDECEKIKNFVVPKNEENFDRLERELLNINPG